MDKSPLRNQSLTRSIHYSTSIEVVSLCGSVAVSGNPPLRDHSSKAQAGSPLLSCHQKCSLARILPSVVKPLQVKNVCWELCCADELGRRAGSLPAEVRGEEGLRWRQWQQGVRVWVSLFSNKSTQGHQRFPVTPDPASLALLSKPYFPFYLNTYPSLYLN